MSKLSAVYAVNSYAYKVLEANNLMSKIDNKTPVVPSSMYSDFASQTKPFMVYGFSRGTSRQNWYWENENLAYTVWGGTPAAVTDVIVALVEAFQRQDESAKDVNKWIRGGGRPTSSPTSYDHLMFTNFTVTSAQGPGPERNQDGKVDGLVIINYSFTAKRAGITTSF